MNSLTEIVRQNWIRVRQEVTAAAEACGRSAGDVDIVGVTKYVDASLTRALCDAGCETLGENRPQALWEKSAALADISPTWHLIGHLQRNKVRRTIPIVSLIHSVDSLRLAEALSQAAVELGREVRFLLEVNVSGDAAKHGLAPEEVLATLDAIAPLGQVRIMGLMAMAGLDSPPAEARRQFAALRQCRDRAAGRGLADNISLEQLSMGMSDDVPLAIAEGATLVRIGSRLFAGCRNVD